MSLVLIDLACSCRPCHAGTRTLSGDFGAVHPGVAMKAEQVLPWIPLILVWQETGDTSKLNGYTTGTEWGSLFLDKPCLVGHVDLGKS